MVPLLYWNLNGTPSEVVPEAILDDLREHSQDNTLRNLTLTAELRRILAAFGSHEIPIVPYKGPVLAASAYGNLAMREFVDLDVLVHKRDFLRAKELLASIGYRQQERLTPTQERAFMHSDGEYHFAPGEMRDPLELHWEITPRTFSFLLDPESLWDRLERTSLGGASVATLSPEDLLLILCAQVRRVLAPAEAGLRRRRGDPSAREHGLGRTREEGRCRRQSADALPQPLPGERPFGS
jgi:hypothetical protein